MSKLNPIYILAFIATIFILSIILVINKKSDFENMSSDYYQINSSAKNFNEYKTTWFDKNRVKTRLDRLLKSSSFRNEKILKSENSNLIKVKIESNKQNILEQFLNRVLNDKFIIKKIELEKTSIYLEIGFR
ncbi:MAG: hypothetical protein ACNI25_09010 [Halarcobacter sp.]